MSIENCMNREELSYSELLNRCIQCKRSNVSRIDSAIKILRFAASENLLLFHYYFVLVIIIMIIIIR